MAFFLSVFISTPSCVGKASKLPQIAIKGEEAVQSPVILGACSVFMKIENAGNAEDTLIGARIKMPGAIAELHDVKDGKMMKIEKIRIPSRSIAELKPKGIHIMIFKMPGDIEDGSELTLFLMFEKSGEKQIHVKLLRKAGSAMPYRYH